MILEELNNIPSSHVLLGSKAQLKKSPQFSSLSCHRHRLSNNLHPWGTPLSSCPLTFQSLKWPFQTFFSKPWVPHLIPHSWEMSLLLLHRGNRGPWVGITSLPATCTYKPTCTCVHFSFFPSDEMEVMFLLLQRSTLPHAMDCNLLRKGMLLIIPPFYFWSLPL